MANNPDKSVTLNDLLVKTFNHISFKRKMSLIVLILLMVLSSFAEAISIGSVIPFIGMISNPLDIMENKYVLIISQSIGLNEKTDLIIFFTFFFIIAVLIAGLIRMTVLWLQIKLSHLIGLEFSIKIFKKTLNQEYEYHTNINSSELLAGITQKASHVVNSVLMPILNMVSSLLILIVILTIFFILNFELTISIVCFFILIYALISLTFKKALSSYSKTISLEQVRVYKILQEGFKGIRYILLGSLQKFYTEIYTNADRPLRNSIANVQVISSLPKIGIETLGIIFLAAIAFWISLDSNNFLKTIPLLGAFALGAQKILPVMQHIYNGLANLRGGYDSLKDTIDLLDRKNQFLITENKTINFNKSIKFKNLSFTYMNSKVPILSKINLEIKKGSLIGIVGKTGSGKSTFIDLILGFLIPSSGQIFIDNRKLKLTNIYKWQQNISYVPQDISLIDATISENVAFGISKNKIDKSRLLEACKKANILEDISSWENKFDTIIGEKGTRLSGGQKQRIGLARALYRNKGLIILDEATSALDVKTENKILNEIELLSKEKTIIIISHKRTTLSICSHIYEIKNHSIKLIKG